MSGDVSGSKLMAFRIAAAYPVRIPRTIDLVREFGLTKCRAHSFVVAMRKARAKPVMPSTTVFGITSFTQENTNG